MDCTNELNEWVYPINGDLSNLTNALVQPPECVRHFTQDMYMCVYIQSTDKHQEIAIESYSTPNTRKMIQTHGDDNEYHDVLLY